VLIASGSNLPDADETLTELYDLTGALVTTITISAPTKLANSASIGKTARHQLPLWVHRPTAALVF